MMVELVDVEWLASRACASRTFFHHPYAQPKNGTPASLRMLTREHLVEAHQRMCRAERYIIIAGPVHADQVLRQLDAAFQNMPAQETSTIVARAESSHGWGVMAPKEDAVQSAF